MENGQCAAGHICPEPEARYNLLVQAPTPKHGSTADGPVIMTCFY